MLKTLKKFFAFCGEDNRKLFVTSIWLGVISAICSAMRIPATAIVIQALLEKNVTMATLVDDDVLGFLRALQEEGEES